MEQVGGRVSSGGRSEKADRVVRCLATPTGSTHRSSTVSVVGEDAQWNRWEVVCTAEEQSGQESVSERPIAWRKESSLEHCPDLS